MSCKNFVFGKFAYRAVFEPKNFSLISDELLKKLTQIKLQTEIAQMCSLRTT